MLTDVTVDRNMLPANIIIFAKRISDRQIILQQVRRYSKVPFICIYNVYPHLYCRLWVLDLTGTLAYGKIYGMS